MKLRSLLIVCCLTLAVIPYSCKKATDATPSPTPPPAPTDEKVLVTIGFSGEITLTDSPLANARKRGDGVYARTLRDSTIYAVNVQRGNSRYSYVLGVFNNTDSIRLELPKGATYTITAAAFKKGSGFGLWYENTGGLQYFGNPLNKALENKVKLASYDSTFLANLTWSRLFTSDSSSPSFQAFYPEMDSYVGTTSLNTDTSRTLTIPMKRVAFGIKFNAVNFTGGRLIAEYSNTMQPKYMTPQNISNSMSIYTADGYRYSETLTAWERIILTLKWEKPDGTVITVGTKELFPPRRNYLTTVNVTLPTSSTTVNTGIGIVVTDTAWTSNSTINF